MKKVHSGEPAPETFIEAYAGTQMFEDFDARFEVIYANSEDLKREAYQIRHKAIKDELVLESKSYNGLKIDSFDHFAHHILIKDRLSDEFLGSIRLVIPQNPAHKLTLPKAIIESDSALSRKLDQTPFGTYGEIADLAILPRHMRNPENRCITSKDFPQITMGLYLAASALAHQLFLADVYASITPMLFKKLRAYGLLLEQTSQTFEVSATKAVYHLNIEKGLGISKTLYSLQSCISSQLSTQLGLFPTVSESSDTA